MPKVLVHRRKVSRLAGRKQKCFSVANSFSASSRSGSGAAFLLWPPCPAGHTPDHLHVGTRVTRGLGTTCSQACAPRVVTKGRSHYMSGKLYFWRL